MSAPSREYVEDENEIDQMWHEVKMDMDSLEPVMENWKSQILPLARIKKIMKSEEVIYLDEELEYEKEKDNKSDNEMSPQRFMIKGEAPVLMAKACELLIRELTMRSWKHTERYRRRTLQKIDVQAAVGENEVYDYLIDIVPRIQEGVSSKTDNITSKKSTKIAAVTMDSQINNDNVHMERTRLTIPLQESHDDLGISLVEAERKLAELTKIHEYIVRQQVENDFRGGLNHQPMMPVHMPQMPLLHSMPLNSHLFWSSQGNDMESFHEHRESARYETDLSRQP